MSSIRPKMPQKPLVVCVGFLGSKPRHVQKYADLISSIEVNVAPLTSTTPILTTPEVIQYIPPLSTFISQSNIRQSAVNLADAIETKLQTPAPLTPAKGRILFPYQTQPLVTPDYILQNLDNYQPRKVVFLCLSNNGAFGYSSMLNLLKRERPALFHKINSQTAGVIWDSSPSHPTPDVFERGFVSAVGTFIGRTPQPKDPILTPIFSGVIGLLLKSSAYAKAASEVTDMLDYNVPYHAPQLYLITEKDDLVLPDATREYVKNRSKRVKEFFARLPTHRSYKDIAEGIKAPEFHHHDSKHDASDGTQCHTPTISFTYRGKQLDSDSFIGSDDAKGISTDIKRGLDWDKIDQQQAGFALNYQYNQHIFPHFNADQVMSQHLNSSSLNTNGKNGGQMVNQQGEDEYSEFHNYHQDYTSKLHQHFPRLDLSKLPKLADHDALTAKAAHGALHKFGIPHKHDEWVHKQQQEEQQGEKSGHDDHKSEPGDFGPGYLEHIKYCPNSHHIDILFDPKQKAALDQLRYDPKIKPLFEKTERFEPECVHHFLYDFKDSAHVQHIRKHPEDYRELVDAFCNYAFRG